MKSVREGTYPSRLPGIAPKAMLDEVTASTDYVEWTQAYMGGQQPPKA